MRVSRHLAPLFVLVLLAAGCNGDGEAPDAGGDGLTFTATGIAPFEGPDSAEAGEVTITFANEAGIGHNFTIEELGQATSTISQGEEEQLTVQLESGETYTLYCSVSGHRDAGMESQLSVN